MRTVLLRHFKERITPLFHEFLPAFVPLKIKIPKEEKKKATLFPNEKIFSWEAKEGLLLFISVVPLKDDAFQMEVGWSTLGKFPFSIQRPTVMFPKKDRREFELPECFIGVDNLYHHKYGTSHLGWTLWKSSAEDMNLNLLNPLDSDTFQKVWMEEYLKPITEKEAEQRAEKAIMEAIEHLKELAFPYFDERIAFYEASRR